MPWPTTSPIATPTPAAVERDGVVPVAAHVGAAGHVARGDLDALHLGQPLREQAALEQLDVRDLALVCARVLDGRSPARSAIRISRLSSSSVKRRGERIATSTTPASSAFTTSGAAISEPRPAAAIIGSSPPPAGSS